MDNPTTTPPDVQPPSTPPPKPVFALSLVRRNTKEEINRPQYRKWAQQLLDGKPLRVTTSYERAICFIPSASFPDNGHMPEGTLIVCYGGSLYQGYVELDFTKSPNPFFLKTKGFPIDIGILICKTIYAMFPHLNPVTEEDLASLYTSKHHPSKASKVLRLAAPKKPRTRKSPVKAESPPSVDASTPPTTQAEPEPQAVTETQTNQDHAPHSPKLRKARKSTRSPRKSRSRKSSGKGKSSDVQG